MADVEKSVSVLLFNSQSQLALRKRGNNDESYPGVWDYTAGGLIEENESNIMAARNILKEEVGVRNNIELQKMDEDIHNYPDGSKEEIVIFRGIYEGEFYPDGVEIAQVKLFSINEIKEMIVSNEDNFHPHFVAVFKRYFVR